MLPLLDGGGLILSGRYCKLVPTAQPHGCPKGNTHPKSCINGLFARIQAFKPIENFQKAVFVCYKRPAVDKNARELAILSPRLASQDPRQTKGNPHEFGSIYVNRRQTRGVLHSPQMFTAGGSTNHALVHGVASITLSPKSIPQSFSSGKVTSRPSGNFQS